MSKGNVNVYICEDGILIHEKKDNSFYVWYESLDFIRIIKSKRTVQEIMHSM